MAAAILTLALLATLIATVVGLVRPSLFSRMTGKTPARWQVLLFGFALMLVIVALVGVTAPAPKPAPARSEAPAQPAPPTPAAPPAAASPAPTSPAPAAAPAREKTAAEKCAVDDLACLGNAGVISASVRCQREVERLAKHSVKWTDSWIGLKFSRFRWTDKPGGNITFIGDKVEFQNGFGAFTPMVYECDMPPDAQRVIAVRAQAGRLP